MRFLRGVIGSTCAILVGLIVLSVSAMAIQLGSLPSLVIAAACSAIVFNLMYRPKRSTSGKDLPPGAPGKGRPAARPQNYSPRR
jgi:hypothetical protein